MEKIPSNYFKGKLVNVSFNAKPFEFRGLLELLEEAFEATFLIEIIGNGLDVSCGVNEGMEKERRRMHVNDILSAWTFGA